MNIEVSKWWILSRIMLAAMVLIAYDAKQIYPATALLLILIQTTAHEFIHAAAVVLTGGKIHKISLNHPALYIEFVSDQERFVYGAGVIFDFLLSLLAAQFLFMSGELFFIGMGFLVILIAIVYSVIPEHSDYNRWRAQSAKI